MFARANGQKIAKIQVYLSINEIICPKSLARMN